MIRVLIVDDHAVVRQGLKQILSEAGDMTVAGEAATSAEAMRIMREREFDTVLLDISLPDRNGVETLKQIKREYPKLPVLMLSMHGEREFAMRSLKAGASGYLTKQSAPAQLVTAMRHVSAGKKYVTPALAEVLADAIGMNDDRPLHETLSDREFQTLRLIAGGQTLSGIAAKLSLSPKTVSVYRARLLEKLQLRNNAELTRYGIETGLVD